MPVKISIIVPCYNVAEYVGRCLDSLINQTLRDIEIICIDDKSTDNTLAILRQYAKRDKRIHVIAQKCNAGVAVARNAGLDLATGRYIGFVDPDDWVDTDFYKVLYTRAQQDNADVAKAGYASTFVETGHTAIINNESIKQNLFDWSYAFWTAIYSHKFLQQHNIRFEDEIITGQDTVFLASVLLNKPTVTFADDVYYHYLYKRPGSLDSQLLPHNKAISKRTAIEMNMRNMAKSNLSRSQKLKFATTYGLQHAYYVFSKDYENDVDKIEMFNLMVDVCRQVKKSAKQKFGKLAYKYLMLSDYDNFIKYLNFRQHRLYAFGIIPIIKTKTYVDRKYVYLLDSILLMIRKG